jgi:hypothetical protein
LISSLNNPVHKILYQPITVSEAITARIISLMVLTFRLHGDSEQTVALEFHDNVKNLLAQLLGL